MCHSKVEWYCNDPIKPKNKGAAAFPILTQISCRLPGPGFRTSNMPSMSQLATCHSLTRLSKTSLEKLGMNLASSNALWSLWQSHELHWHELHFPFRALIKYAEPFIIISSHFGKLTVSRLALTIRAQGQTARPCKSLARMDDLIGILGLAQNLVHAA